MTLCPELLCVPLQTPFQIIARRFLIASPVFIAYSLLITHTPYSFSIPNLPKGGKGGGGAGGGGAGGGGAGGGGADGGEAGGGEGENGRSRLHTANCYAGGDHLDNASAGAGAGMTT